MSRLSPERLVPTYNCCELKILKLKILPYALSGTKMMLTSVRKIFRPINKHKTLRTDHTNHTITIK